MIMKIRPLLMKSTTATTAALVLHQQQRRGMMVNLHGHTSVCLQSRHDKQRRGSSKSRLSLLGSVSMSERTHVVSGERPPDPNSLLNDDELQAQADKLIDWWQQQCDGDNNNVLCLTGAGISTESGVPDYRGNNGSYHIGHKPMIHDQFVKSSHQRQRYWGRGMVGWRFFDEKQPNAGHHALTQLEQLGKLGVTLSLDDDESNNKQNEEVAVSVITQNVDSLHRRAGTKHLIELHGRTDQLTCMHCGIMRDRKSFHEELETLNHDWLQAALRATDESSDMRADGDAAVATRNYQNVQVPPCQHCSTGFMKPEVVFFGDSVPPQRVQLVQKAVAQCAGLLVVGSSLAVHSAFRHVRAAHARGIPIAILNVGETRAETEGLMTNVLKIEAPAGPTLSLVAKHFAALQQDEEEPAALGIETM